MRIETAPEKNQREAGYGAFGRRPGHQEAGGDQPFGYTGYQRMVCQEPTMPRGKGISGEEDGRFTGKTLITVCDRPQTIYKYKYYINNPFLYF